MIKRIFSYTGAFKRYVILSPIFVVIETGGELILPLLIAQIIDAGIQQGNMTVIYQMGLLMIALAVCSVISGSLSARMGSYGSLHRHRRKHPPGRI